MFKERNDKIRSEILSVAAGLTDSELNLKPEEGQWSPMEILEHLNLMETYIAHNLSKQIANEQSEKTFKKPIQLTLNRLVKVNAPASVVPSGEYTTLAEMRKRLGDSRNFLNEIYNQTPVEVLKRKSMRHPVFGKVPLIQWFSFIGLHEHRHLKQLKKTIEKTERYQKR